jgi:hypothetical protein
VYCENAELLKRSFEHDFKSKSFRIFSCIVTRIPAELIIDFQFKLEVSGIWNPLYLQHDLTVFHLQ